jgi:hypothetical protein
MLNVVVVADAKIDERALCGIYESIKNRTTESDRILSVEPIFPPVQFAIIMQSGRLPEDTFVSW